MPDVKTFGALWVRLKQFRVPVIFWIALAFFGGIALWWRVYLDTNGGNDDRKLMVALGTSGLALAFGGVLGGIVKKLFDAWDDRKHALDARAAFLANLVDDFKTVYDMVERARFLITAHKACGNCPKRSSFCTTSAERPSTGGQTCRVCMTIWKRLFISARCF